MLDLSYFQNQNSNVQGFFNGGTWQTWVKPRGAKTVTILCNGSGGGGGGGFQSASTPRSGGSGGGAGAISHLTIDAKLLPDILYILPGIGGAGGLGGVLGVGTSGGNGENSFVCLIPNTASTSNVVLRSGSQSARGGGVGTTVSPGTTLGELSNVIANNIFANLGTFSFLGSANGLAGGTNNGVPGFAGRICHAGAGGGGIGTGGNFGAGGSVFPGLAGGTVNGDGKDGPIYYKPSLMLYSGTGGGGSSAAGTNGGNGGKGAPGCGGGGGGASSNTGVNAGNGGRGGDGFVIITTSL